MANNILLFGPGFVGRIIAQLAPESGFKIITASRSGENSDIVADLTDLNSLVALEKEYKPDYVIHCAASDRAMDAQQRLSNYRAVYLQGAENICAAFPQAKKIFTSSTSVYAQTDGSTVTETSPTLPSSETAKTLLQAEAFILQNQGTVARFSGIYGDGRNYLIKQLNNGDASLPAATEDRILNHIHAHDAASACLHLLTQPSGIYNVNDSTHHTRSQTLTALSEKLNLPLTASNQTSITARGFSNKAISNKKLLSTGWKPHYPCFITANTQPTTL